MQTNSSLSQRLTALPDRHFAISRARHIPVIEVNGGLRYQRFTGLGAAMTDSSAWLIYDELSRAARARLMEQLFGSRGIRLNFLRVPMGASDFAAHQRPYSYDDLVHSRSDPRLLHFSIAHDLGYIIPALRQARRIDRRLELLANPWSPPAWMKTNDSLDNNGGSGVLRTSAYQPLAHYFVKFIKAYARHRVPIQAITPQNEPSYRGHGTSYPGLTLPESAEASFIANDLSPALDAARLHVKIYGNDLSWGSSSYASALAAGPAAPDLAGIAWHCYFGSPSAVTALHKSNPALDQIDDECSPELRSFGTPEYLISSLRNWASAVSVWNLALDPQGEPKLAANGCPGCVGVVTIDERARAVSLRSTYYQLGQVSAFVRPGAIRIGSPNFVRYGVNSSNIETITPGLDDVAFLNPNGSRVVVAYDNSSAPVDFAVAWHGRSFTYRLAPDALVTFVWNPRARRPRR